MHSSKAASESPSLAALSADNAGYALFFDIDGTLLDLAPTPDSVVVDPALVDALEKLRKHLYGAVALVTGRPLEFVAERFPSYSGAVAALHGTEFRLPSGHVEMLEPGAQFERAKDFIRQTQAGIAGLLVEDKGNAIAVHFRAAPEKEDIARELIDAAEKLAGPDWRVQAGKFVFELRSRHGDKGAALRRLMRSAAFAGRRPIAFGDDLTDVPMLRAAMDMGGLGVAVGDAIRDLPGETISSPAAVRAWIIEIAGNS
jgi:trehalose 6-phosphate phosphatase